MGKTPDVGFTSDKEQKTFFLRSIQEPALISQAQSLLVSIINKNQMQPVKLRGRAQLPTHLKIIALSETLVQTIQPLDNELDYAPSANRMQLPPPYGQFGFGLPQMPYGTSPFGTAYPPPYYRPVEQYTHSPEIYDASANQHIMQGYDQLIEAAGNSTEHCKGTPLNVDDANPRPVHDRVPDVDRLHIRSSSDGAHPVHEWIHQCTSGTRSPRLRHEFFHTLNTLNIDVHRA